MMTKTGQDSPYEELWSDSWWAFWARNRDLQQVSEPSG